MKKYIVERVSDSAEDSVTHINAPNIDAIKRWITETEKRTVLNVYSQPDGSVIIFAGNIQFIVKKWKEPMWLTL